jgi:N-acetylneuraminic acid mutarotase
MRHSAKAFILAFVTALTMAIPSIAQDESSSVWKRLPDMAVPRWEAGSVVFENKLYVFGGFKMPTKACKRADAFDPKDNSWTKLKYLPSAITHMNINNDKRIWFLGGMAQVGEKRWIDNKITALTSEDKWKHVGELPQPLSATAAGIIDGKLYLAGGSPDGATPQPAMWVRSAP